MLTELATVKNRLGIAPADTTYDALLDAAIGFWSGRFEQECHRKFARVSNATYEFRADALYVWPERTPIEIVSAFELKRKESEGWLAQAELDYLLGPKRHLVELALPIGTELELARITYTGGYVLPGATPSPGQAALPVEIEQACVEQVACWYLRRNDLGLIANQPPGGGYQQFAALDLLPQVRAVLQRYTRWLN